MNSGRQLRILLVEDNEGDARLIRELLRDEGFAGILPRNVATLKAARAILEAEPVDVLLLDLSLPDSYGFETVEAMLVTSPELPIIVLTGLDREAVAIHAVQAGAQDYLVKGQVDGAGLSRAIRYAVERKQLVLERERLLSSEKEARERAERAVRARDEVLRMVSHDLGNEIAAIRVNALVLGRTLDQVERLEENRHRVDGIVSQVAIMERMRQDLLDTACIEAGKLSVALDLVDPGQLVRDVATSIEALIAGRQQNLTVEVQDGLPKTLLDPDRIHQALGNLIGNAVKFSPPGGTIGLRAGQADEGIVFSVSDKGDGVSESDADRIFMSFWKRTKGNPSGAGLGLAIVRGIAEAHGGRVWHEPNGNQGSIFHLLIPLGQMSEHGESTRM